MMDLLIVEWVEGRGLGHRNQPWCYSNNTTGVVNGGGLKWQRFFFLVVAKKISIGWL